MAAPIVVHRPSPSGGRRVTVRGEILGVAYSDEDLSEFLRRAGLEHGEAAVAADSDMIEWRGGREHQYDAA
ncbi:hypothetical protein [Streptomyces sp. NPDC047315]|uniref:hypothetical protein n=1 Tax=Streptomyces sp. NPDC047315 TaxID=3155142 RepID=UPI0033CBBF01